MNAISYDGFLRLAQSGFLYLDGSNVLREIAYEPNKTNICESLTALLIKKNPERFYGTYYFLKKKYWLENQHYFSKLSKLCSDGTIISAITLNTFADTNEFDSTKINMLMGSFGQFLCEKCENYSVQSDSTSFRCSNCGSILRPSHTLWNEDISFKKYNLAAMEIASAQIIVIDNSFLVLEVGRSLLDYAHSNCILIFVGENSQQLASEAMTFITMNPVELIYSL